MSKANNRNRQSSLTTPFKDTIYCVSYKGANILCKLDVCEYLVSSIKYHRDNTNTNCTYCTL